MSEYLLRREFRDIKNLNLKKNNNWIKPNILELASIQYFARRYVNIKTQNNRVLFKLGTGVGKTLTSLYTALSFIKLFYIIYQKTGKLIKVFIVGFSKSVFKKEFLKFPELGIITYEELHELGKLKEMQRTAPDYLLDEIKRNLINLKTKIHKKISNIPTGGMYEFFGYKELFNNLVITKDIPIDTDASNILRYVNEGKIKINKYLLEKFQNSLMICDEIHLAYNSEVINNYGLAIQYLLDYYRENIFLILLTATIINNSKREILDIGNFLRSPGTTAFHAKDFPELYNKNLQGLSVEIWQKKLKSIYDQLYGKVLFLEESGEDYPTLRFEGEQIKGIPYLKFIPCKMSELHEKTFQSMDLYRGKTKNFIIYDMVFPNPPNSNVDKDIGLTDSTTLINLISNSPSTWKDKFDIETKEMKTYSICSGNFLKYENLKLYSSKYVQMIDTINKILIKNPRTKIMIYHPYVVGSGVATIAEILKYNGFCEFNSPYGIDTYSSEEHITAAEWKKKYPSKPFYPSKYILIDSDTNESMKDNYVDEWNLPDNCFGKYAQIIIGAGKIKQSIDFKDTTVLFIMRIPKNMSDFIQVKGRVVRKSSLMVMNNELRKLGINPSNIVEIYTFLSVGEKPLALEVRKYIRKLQDFDDIRNIEYTVNRFAVNNYIYINEQNIMKFEPIDELGSLPFEAKYEIPKKMSSINYFDNNYYYDTISEINKWIKKAFISVQVWDYDSLWNFIKVSNLVLDDKISKQLYSLVLNNLIYRDKIFIDNKSIDIFDTENIYINKLFYDGIEIKTNKKVIIERGKYLILTMIGVDGKPIAENNIFLMNELMNKKLIYNINFKNKKFFVKNNVEKIKNEIINLKGSDIEDYKLKFLTDWSNDDHYLFMENQIMENIELPSFIISTYKSLNLMGNNWYENKLHRLIYENNEWIERPKKIIEIEENELFGIISDQKFKIKEKDEKDKLDNRTKKRGIVCSTVEKSTIFSYAERLGIDIKKRKIKSICNIIFQQLLKREIKTRKGGDNKRYLYVFE